MNKYNYTNPFSYKLIYIFRINDDQHSGILKVGDTSINYAGSPDDLTPSCELLNKAAKERILAVDRSKFDRIAFTEIGALEEISTVITDEKPEAKWLQVFQDAGVECIYPE